MRDSIKKIVMALFPELVGQFHLPMFGRVLAIADPPTDVTVSDPFRPRYAVDLVMLDAQGKDKPDMTFEAVPVTMPAGGEGAGVFGLPKRGAIVEVAFAYGLPCHPFVRQVMPTWQGVPGIEAEALTIQQAAGVYQSANTDGSWDRVAPGTITDSSLARLVEAVDNVETLRRSLLEVAENSTELVGGVKLIEALGALKLLSGGSINVSAVDNLNLTTAADINATAGRNYTAAIEGVSDSLAKLQQRIHVASGGTIWLGDDADNILQILSDLIQVVANIATISAAHIHGGVQTGSGSTATPTSTGQFTAQGASANALKGTLDPMVE